jgi:hypothetical protein
MKRALVPTIAALLAAISSSESLAAVFVVGPGDTQGLISAINAANANNEADSIVLAPQSAYAFSQPDNLVDGANALPSVVTEIAIVGNGSTISRSDSPVGVPPFRLFHVSDTGSLAIEGLTLSNGDVAEFDNPNARGGGILSHGLLTLSAVTFQGNTARAGGGVFASLGHLDVIDSDFFGNTTNIPNGSGGGGIFFFLSTGSVSGSSFYLNQSLSGGGAIAIGLPEDESMLIKDSDFLFNSAPAATGGAVQMIDGAHVDIEHSQFVGNTAFQEGAVSICEESMRIDSSSFSLNSNGAVGITCANTGEMLVENSTFAFNQAVNDPNSVLNPRAAALNAVGGTLTVVNSTFSANAGTAINTALGTAATTTILHSTITDSQGYAGAGGLMTFDNGVLNLVNTIVANSTSGADCVNLGTLGASIGSLVEDGSCSASMAGDPKLDALADNGGPTETHALFAGSPAIDMAWSAECTPEDQRGVARPIGAGCDIGAYEGSKIRIERIRIDYITKPLPYYVVCDPLLPEVITVAMLGSERFQARTLVPESVRLGGSDRGEGKLADRPFRDVNRDGLADVVMSWRLEDVYDGLRCQATRSLALSGSTRSGAQIYASVAVETRAR